MKNFDKIHIVFACDDNYAQHAGVAITSLREQQRTGLPVQVHVLDGGISPDNLDRLLQLKDRHLEISIYKGNIDEYSKYLVLEHFSNAMYLRLSIEKILPKEIERIMYCDCDIVFLKPIDPLWNIDLKGNILAAVSDGHPANLCRKDLGIDVSGRYFNSGVLLIDLGSWRERQVCERVKGFIRSNWDKLQYPDQDGLNAILFKDWLPLDVSWNTLTCTVNKKKMPSPHIVHFVSQFKPWLYKSLDPFQDQYFKYLKLTPWREYQFPDKNWYVWAYRTIILYAPEKVFQIIFFFTSRIRSLLSECARRIALLKMKTGQK